jgi:anti-sigma B factor antagonist
MVDFRIETTEVAEDTFRVALAGEVDLYTAAEVRAELGRLIELGASRIVVDLTSTTYIDSTTLGVLLGALKRLQPNGGELVLVCPERNIRKVFEITSLDRVFTIFDSTGEALATESQPA